MKFSTYTSSVLITMSLAFGLMGTTWAEAEDQKSGESTLSETVLATDAFVGAWVVTLTNSRSKITNPALYSFIPGGILNQSESPMVDPVLGNLVFSNAHGTWSYDAVDNSYTILYQKLVFQADAAFWGHEKTTGKLRFDDKGNLTGTIRVGNNTSQFTSEFSGKRITAD